MNGEFLESVGSTKQYTKNSYTYRYNKLVDPPMSTLLSGFSRLKNVRERGRK